MHRIFVVLGPRGLFSIAAQSRRAARRARSNIGSHKRGIIRIHMELNENDALEIHGYLYEIFL